MSLSTLEKIYKEFGLANETSDEALIDAMLAHPKLIECLIDNVINLIG